ncbi:hypothetical protein [Bacillus methanolicus]|nr:hypothetical protein [Bacillus methanolicus]
MKKKKDKQNANSANVEFGSEFGDINANKFFEISFMNQKNKEKSDQKSDC